MDQVAAAAGGPRRRPSRRARGSGAPDRRTRQVCGPRAATGHQLAHRHQLPREPAAKLFARQHLRAGRWCQTPANCKCAPVKIDCSREPPSGPDSRPHNPSQPSPHPLLHSRRAKPSLGGVRAKGPSGNSSGARHQKPKLEPIIIITKLKVWEPTDKAGATSCFYCATAKSLLSATCQLIRRTTRAGASFRSLAGPPDEQTVVGWPPSERARNHFARLVHRSLCATAVGDRWRAVARARAPLGSHARNRGRYVHLPGAHSGCSQCDLLQPLA